MNTVVERLPLLRAGPEECVVQPYERTSLVEGDFTAVNAKKPRRDTYGLFLRDVIGSQFGKKHIDDYAVSFHTVAGKEVCRIRITPAAKPVYLNGDFYLRDGNKKSKLKAKEATEYIKRRWG